MEKAELKLYCTEHPTKILEFYCEQCEVSLCHDCVHEHDLHAEKLSTTDLKTLFMSDMLKLALEHKLMMVEQIKTNL